MKRIFLCVVYLMFIQSIYANKNLEAELLPESPVEITSEWAESKYKNLITHINNEEYDQAFIDATMLASSGDVKAKCILATMYMCEVGTIRNYESAQELLASAAKDGYNRAEYMLGGFGSLEKSHEFMRSLLGEDSEDIYKNDNNFWYQMLSTETKPDNYKDAFQWFYLKDGQWGYRDIMYYAGIVLIQGSYGYKNPQAGLKWLIKSAQLGYGDAINLLNKLNDENK